MAITLLGHQPIDFTYSENGSCENLSDQCLHYETGDNPMFQVKASGSSVPMATIKGIGETDFDEVSIPILSQGNGFFTYQINFEDLGITEGCFEVCVFDGNQTAGNLVTNGTFGTNLSGWTVADGQSIFIDFFSNPSDHLTCNGQVSVNNFGGTGPYTYSKDGVNYSGSTFFTGLCYDTEYSFCVKDNYGVVECIPFEFRDCSTFAGSDAFDIKAIYAFEITLCEAFDFV